MRWPPSNNASIKHIHIYIFFINSSVSDILIFINLMVIIATMEIKIIVTPNLNL
jgi:hypothetical protein